jgi:catechol 2,3-dioxygenase-like lactoylglutathione lyase family enzyme
MKRRVAVVATLAVLATTLVVAREGDDARATPVIAVDTIGMTVNDMDRAVAFYTSVLTFEKISDVEVSGRDYELMEGVFGARMRIVRLRLGEEVLELTEYLAPKGRPLPFDMRPNDLAFQHVAIIVSDMDQAYARLRAAGVEHASTGPQRLPDWNTGAGGISAFYFRDPDRHFLEILHFPAGKGLEKWQRTDRLFLGIDHTAIVVSDTDRSLALYRDALQLRVAGASENFDIEQEHLNNVFGARLRITALRAARGAGVELLEYLAPRSGRRAPEDLQANDIAHWQITMLTSGPDGVFDLARRRLLSLVSPVVVTPTAPGTGIRRAALTRDPDGHGLRFAVAGERNARPAAASNGAGGFE